MTEDGEIDGTFNIHFLKLSGSEMKRNLELAKEIPFARTNEQLKEYKIPGSLKGKDSIYQLLDALKACGLKNDALMEVLYEQIGDGFAVDYPYAVFIFHGVYDIPVKAKDKEWLEGSEEIYDFLICTVSPMSKSRVKASQLSGVDKTRNAAVTETEYEPDKPVFGFLYPAFSERSSDDTKVDIFNVDPRHPSEGLMYKLAGIR